jgi:hypothetical protein
MTTISPSRFASCSATQLEPVTAARRPRDDSPYAQTHAEISAAAISTTVGSHEHSPRASHEHSPPGALLRDGLTSAGSVSPRASLCRT